MPDDEWGQRLEAVVAPAPGADVNPDSLRTLVRERLRGSKTPERVHVADAPPGTDAGKLIRRQVPALPKNNC